MQESRRIAEEPTLGWQERLAGAVSRFAGTMTFVHVHLVAYGVWIAINAELVPGVARFDPSFVILAMEGSVEAISLSEAPELDELSRDVHPEQVLERMDQHERTQPG